MLILHVGLPKTGTTLLQHRIFARAPGITFLHRRSGGEAATTAWAFRRYAMDNPLLAAPQLWRLRRQLNAAARRGQPVLLTDENISIGPLDFWHGRGPTPASLARRIALLARVIDPSLLPVRLIVGIRRQDKWLASRYAESSRHFPDFGQADFDRRMREIVAAPGLAGPLAWLDYRAMRDAFAAKFGAGSVHLVPLERIVADPLGTVRGMTRFLGIPIVRGRAGIASLQRPRNKLSTGENVWRLRRDDTELVLDPGLQAELRARFAGSNRALAAEMALGFEP